jgi:predicted GIY-YIG superfamily endonuclease
MLTADCFKTLCMQARTKKAGEVRAYFLAVENALFRYREEIAEGMARRIGVLERNQGPTLPKPAEAGVIYVIRASESMNSVYKIGRTVNLAQRLRSHSSALADSLKVVYVFKTRCVDKVESCMKLMLKERQYRRYKEVYQIDIESLKKVITGCNDACIETVFYRNHKPAAVKGGGTGARGGGYYAVLVRMSDYTKVK